MANLVSSYVKYDSEARIDRLLQETDRYRSAFKPSGNIMSRDIPSDLYVEEFTTYKPILINEEVVHITSMRILAKDNSGNYTKEYVRPTFTIEKTGGSISCASFEVKSKLQEIFDAARF